MVAVSGAATYPQRIALPPDAQLLIEVRTPSGESLAVHARALDGAQVPAPFALDVPVAGQRTLRLAITSGLETLWMSGPVSLGKDPEVDGIDLGDIRLRQPAVIGPDHEMLCRDGRWRVGFDGEAAILATPDGAVALTRTGSDDGGRFASADGQTAVEIKGDTALLQVGGQDRGECRFVPPAIDPTWEAQGNEPFWKLTVEAGRMTLLRPASSTVEVLLPATEIRDDAFVYAGEAAILGLSVRESLCHDSMTGMPYPESVTVTAGQNELSGCGGDPLSLLTGGNWTVEAIGGEPVIEDSPVTLAVGLGGEVSGKAGCNVYSSSLELTGEGLSLSPIAATMMACQGPLMDQETAFLRALDGVDSFDLDETGALHLKVAGETAILARRTAR